MPSKPPAKAAKRSPAAKVLRALSWMVARPDADYGVRELAAALHTPPSGAHRLLKVLLEEGFVRQDPHSSRYLPGAQLLRLANIAVSKSPLGQLADARMRELVETTGESALLGHLDVARLEMMFVKIVESDAPLRYAVNLNSWIPLHAGASGLAILAFLSGEQIEQVIRQTRLQAITDRTVTDPEQLRLLLKQIRGRGFALTRGQRLPGAVGIAAPIFDHAGQVVGDICLTVPEQRFDRGTAILPRLVLQCAAAVTADIGGVAQALRQPSARR
jgi:DNA-binding IclR family transcriptional regulator